MIEFPIEVEKNEINFPDNAENFLKFKGLFDSCYEKLISEGEIKKKESINYLLNKLTLLFGEQARALCRGIWDKGIILSAHGNKKLLKEMNLPEDYYKNLDAFINFIESVSCLMSALIYCDEDPKRLVFKFDSIVQLMKKFYKDGNIALAVTLYNGLMPTEVIVDKTKLTDSSIQVLEELSAKFEAITMNNTSIDAQVEVDIAFGSRSAPVNFVPYPQGALAKITVVQETYLSSKEDYAKLEQDSLKFEELYNSLKKKSDPVGSTSDDAFSKQISDSINRLLELEQDYNSLRHTVFLKGKGSVFPNNPESTKEVDPYISFLKMGIKCCVDSPRPEGLDQNLLNILKLSLIEVAPLRARSGNQDSLLEKLVSKNCSGFKKLGHEGGIKDKLAKIFLKDLVPVKQREVCLPPMYKCKDYSPDLSLKFKSLAESFENLNKWFEKLKAKGLKLRSQNDNKKTRPKSERRVKFFEIENKKNKKNKRVTIQEEVLDIKKSPL